MIKFMYCHFTHLQLAFAYFWLFYTLPAETRVLSEALPQGPVARLHKMGQQKLMAYAEGYLRWYVPKAE